MRVSTELQNVAAGGLEARRLRIEGGVVVCASVAVRIFPRSPHLYAYLQFKHAQKTVTRYIGNVTDEDSARSLKAGWELLRKKKVAEKNGWAWLLIS